MENLNKIELLFNILLPISFVVSIVVMSKIKSTTKSDISLSKNEKIIVWVTCFFAPIFAGLVYYFGWKKLLPKKSKQAGNIAWLAIIAVGVFWGIINAIINTR